MTSQPEAALPEAQAAYERALKELMQRTHMQTPECDTYAAEAERLIALQAARIASLERENAAAVGKLRTARGLLTDAWGVLVACENLPLSPGLRSVVKKLINSLEAWNVADVGLEPVAAQAPADAADESGVTA